MDFMLVASLLLVPILSGPSYRSVAGETDKCKKLCPPGYHKTGDCTDPDAPHRCGKCDTGTFIDMENYKNKCLRCRDCYSNEMEIAPCLPEKDRICGCKDNYYYKNRDARHCVSCSTEDLSNSDYKRKCNRSTPPVTNLPLTTLSAAATTASVSRKTSASAPVPGARTSNTSSDPELNQQDKSPNLGIWLYLMMFVSIFLVVFWILLLFRKLFRNQGSCCWSLIKDLTTPAQEAAFNEQRSRHCSSPTTLTLNFSEEAPMMPLCQEPPAHIYSCMPVPAAAKNDEHSDRWPAIVLYAIIKEVPLRRWKEFLRLLSVSDQQMERVELEAGLGSMEKQYQMLRLWSQRSSASLNDVYSSLHHMELSGCAQLLQENLEKLKWRLDAKQGLAV